MLALACQSVYISCSPGSSVYVFVVTQCWLRLLCSIVDRRFVSRSDV